MPESQEKRDGGKAGLGGDSVVDELGRAHAGFEVSEGPTAWE